MANANSGSAASETIGHSAPESNEGDTDTKSAAIKIWTIRVGKFTALLVAVTVLVGSAGDLYKKVMHLPISDEEEAAAKLYHAHFGKEPIIKQPFIVKRDNFTVEMLIAVYETGDVFVRSGTQERWLPFDSPRRTAIPGISLAFAQSTPPSSSPSLQSRPITNDAIKLDVNVLQQRQAQPAIGGEKSFLVAQDKAPSGTFRPSTETFSKSFSADPGFRFTETGFEVLSGSRYEVQPISLSLDRRTATVTFKLTSGPFYDQYRAWLQGTLRTNQERIP